MEEGSVGDVASCDLDLHQVNKPIAARDRDASHARREAKLHRRRRFVVVTVAVADKTLKRATKRNIRSAAATPLRGRRIGI